DAWLEFVANGLWIGSLEVELDISMKIKPELDVLFAIMIISLIGFLMFLQTGC
ncbi:hypothetical protein RYX36_022086, partial [Vicia faba]